MMGVNTCTELPSKLEDVLTPNSVSLLSSACYSVVTSGYEYVIANEDGLTATHLNIEDLISLALLLERLNTRKLRDLAKESK